MTDTDLSTAPRRRGGLTGMVLADLRALASEMGLSGTAGMRKGDLIVAIKEKQGGSAAARVEKTPAAAAAPTVTPPAPAVEAPAAPAPAPAAEVPAATRPPRTRRTASRPTGAPEAEATTPAATPPAASEPPEPVAVQPASEPATESRDGRERQGRNGRQSRAERQAAQNGAAQNGAAGSTAVEAAGQPTDQDGRAQDGRAQNGRAQNGRAREQNDRDQRDRDQRDRDQNDRDRDQRDRDQRDRDQQRDQDGRDQDGRDQNGTQPGGRNPRNDSDDDEGGRGRRGGRRFRERRRGRDRGDVGTQPAGQSRDDREVEVRDDDVLQPVAGILDVLDNYAFVRTSGYLAGSNDVYVAMNMVRKNGLRRGDAVTGAVRVPREGEAPGGGSRQKFNPLVRIDTINGGDAEAARKRPEFGKLTPLYPNQRLRLETTPNILTTRVIDLVMPIGKGQRALIVSPPKAGKTSVLQAIANAISVNNPECHLMVVLVDERPEEVTDMQRSVKGEVISSTFDRPPGDHTAVAELAIERAKRLVEGGMDVVVLLDSITRLGRAYNNSSPASGRILSGGVDSTALYPPKRFLGAARNIENGGSLTIIATAMVETGSTGDTVIFEEFKGTGNAELKLDRKIAERRVFPAVDVNPSGTRKDELLMNHEEYAVALKLRRVLSGLDSHQAIDLLIDRLRKSSSNAEFMMQVAKTAPAGMANPDES